MDGRLSHTKTLIEDRARSMSEDAAAEVSEYIIISCMLVLTNPVFIVTLLSLELLS